MELSIATSNERVHIQPVSTMIEIQGAIKKLPQREKKALSAWLSSQDESEMSRAEEANLLASLDKAAQQLDAGHGVPIDRARNLVRQWASK
jgi:hypothetical protein